MAPLRPEQSRSGSGQSEPPAHHSDEPQAQQAGRSAIHLAAQQSVQSLREAQRPALRTQQSPWSSTPNLLVGKTRNTPSLSDARSPLSPASSDTHQVSPHTPSVASPLNSTPPSSGGATDSRMSSPDTVGSLPGQNGKAPYRHNRYLTVPARSNVARKPSRPSLAFTPDEPHPLPRNSTPLSSSQSLSSPRSVRDLGSDYTRYFNPFSSPRSSQHDLSRRSSAYVSVDGMFDDNWNGDTIRRMSDPFGDSKRMSNPFVSADEQRNLPPQGPEHCPIHEVHPAIITLQDQPRVGTPVFARPSDPEKLAFFQYLDDRLGAPGHVFPLITDDKEDDDDMHMPQWDDDIRWKPKLRDHFTRDNIVSTFGLFAMLCGLLCIFVVLPILSWTGVAIIDYPGEINPGPPQPPPWNYVNDNIYPLLKNVRQGLIDPDTPSDVMTRQSINGETLKLVFSDEFNKINRTFYPGDDPYWFGFDGWYGATEDLEWYDPDAINTWGGTIELQMDQFASHGLNFRSGMLNSWNQLCFKGGVFEVSMSLPGPAGVHGLWPGVWTMGNLGRPGYLSTTHGLWPYTYDECDVGITPNQSSTDGISFLPGQRLPSCTCPGEQHPTPGKGRGAPEIDIAEVSASWGNPQIGVATQSFQVAPFDIWWYPDYNFMENPDPHVSLVNSYTGGPYQQAVSTTSYLNNSWYDGNEYQKFAYEYSPGGDETSFVAWTIGDDEMMKFDARSIGPNGNVGQRLVSEEPMAIIMNLGISNNWVSIDWQDLKFPTILRIDYVRWYQREGEEMVTCDPPGYETTDYIRRHPRAYNNPNMTLWEQTGYPWPKNSFMHGCDAQG